MFASGAGFWALGASVTQPIFEGGMLLHKERAQRALLVEAAEQYRSAVLTACQNVADTLNALEQDATALKAAAAANDAAKVSLDLARQQWKAGYAGYLTAVNRRAGLSAGGGRIGSGTGEPLRGYRGVVPGAGRRMVESIGSG